MKVSEYQHVNVAICAKRCNLPNENPGVLRFMMYSGDQTVRLHGAMEKESCTGTTGDDL